MSASVRLEPNALRRLLAMLFERHGCDPLEATVVAEHLVDADLKGHPSHGVGLVPIYVDNLQRGEVVANRRLARVPSSGGVLVYDGARGFGQSLGRELVAAVAPLALEHGAATFGLRDVHHLGRIGDYGERFAAHGCASLLFVNTVSRPIVAPFGGMEARFGTNPVCITVPRTPAPPVVLDFATSAIAVGKCRVALENGRPLPDDVAIDAAGVPTTDPRALYAQPQGALRAMGGHKGSGLNLACELLAACMAGLTMGSARPQAGSAINTLFGTCFRVDAVEGAHERIEAVVEYYLGTRAHPEDGPLLLPGMPETLSAAALASTGVPLAPRTWQAIVALAEHAGIPADRVQRTPVHDPGAIA